MKKKRENILTKRAKICSLAVGLLIGWAIIITSTASIHGITSSDLGTTDFASTSLSAEISASQQRLADGDPAGAAILAKQALMKSPISSSALRTLALAEQEQKHQTLAVAIFSQGSALGWRDVPTQIWLAQAQLESGNGNAAAERLDAALRTAPLSHDLHAILDEFVTTGQLAPEIARRMAKQPYWRGVYLSDVDGTSIAARLRLVQQLAAQGNRPSRGEILSLVTALIRNNDVNQARKIWVDSEKQSSSTLYDPEFQHVKSTAPIPFEWILLPVIGSDSEILSPSGISVTTDGSAAGVLARQLVTLKAGRHSLAVRGLVPQAARPVLAWTVRCTMQSKTLVENQDASAVTTPFDIPENCPAQFVELRVRNSPQPISVMATYNRLILN